MPTPAIHQLDEIKDNIFIRKMLRSKKLTRLLKLGTVPQPIAPLSNLIQRWHLDSRTLVNPTAIARVAPRYLDDQAPHDMDMPQHPLVFPAVRVVRLRSARVTGHSSLVEVNGYIAHHDLFDVQTHTLSDELNRRIAFQPLAQTARKQLKDHAPFELQRAATFTDSIAPNYAHWLTEVLPRIVVLSLQADFDRVPYIVDAKLHPNIQRTLELVVGNSRDIYLLPRDRQINVAELSVVSPTGYIPLGHRDIKKPGHSHGIFSSTALKMTVELLKSRLGVKPPLTPSRKIYVKRNSHGRNLRNADELEQALVSIGFDVVEPEKMSFDDQVRTFSSARIIVGATGAAMANLLFAPASCNVFIVIAQHPDTPYYYWQNMAACVGLTVTYVVGKQTPDAANGVHSDFCISAEQIVSLKQAVSTI